MDPAKYLEEPKRSEYLDIHSRQLPPHLWPSIPKSCHKAKADTELSLLLQLEQCGMGTWVLESDVLLHDLDNKPFVCSGGFFAVPHKATSDRLIFDKRAANVMQRRLKGWARLPHGIMFVRLC